MCDLIITQISIHSFIHSNKNKTKKNQWIKDLNYNPAKPGSLWGWETFYKSLQQSNIIVDKDDLKEWLLTQDAYTLHYPKIKKFRRNKVIVSG